MKNPFFSIIMPTYNRAAFLPASVASVLQQSFPKWELIIIDDGSEDSTKEVVESFKDERIKYFYQENRGVSAARNLGIDKSRGLYICFLDDDDEFLKIHLSFLYSNIIEKQLPKKLLCTDVYIRDNDELTKNCHVDLNETRSFNRLPWTPAVCIHREILDEHLFHEKLYVREDHELFDRIRRDYGIITLSKCTLVINWHAENTIKDKLKFYRGLEHCIYFYITDRKRISYEELEKLSEAYYHLFIKYASDKDYRYTIIYFLKLLLLFPWVFYRKETMKRYKGLAVKIKNKLFTLLNTQNA